MVHLVYLNFYDRTYLSNCLNVTCSVNLESMLQNPGITNKLESALKSKSYASTDSRTCLSGLEDNIAPPNMLIFGNSRLSIASLNQPNDGLDTKSCELQVNDGKDSGGETYGEGETTRFLKSGIMNMW